MANTNVKRIIFREVMDGDLKKFTATAAPSGTGGGARDLRFRPFDKFDGVFARALPRREKVERRREGEREEIEIYTAKANVVRSNNESFKKEIAFEPPTTARPNEGRLARVHDLNLDVPEGEGRLLILIIQDGKDELIITFFSEKDLESGKWHAAVNDFFKEVFSQPARASATQGYIDFEQKSRWIK